MNGFVFSDSYRLDGNTGSAVESSGFTPQNSISLKAVRNEYVSFQLAVYDIPEGIRLEDIEIKADSDPAFETEVFYEWFHQLGDAEAKKLVPDMLIPWALKDNIGLSKTADKYFKSEYAVFWIDCYIPKDTEPGTYQVKATASAGGQSVSFTADINVVKAELCDEALIQADMNNYADTVTRNYPVLIANKDHYQDGSYFDVEKEFYRVTHEHRAVFHHLPYTHSGYEYPSFAPELEGEGNTIRVSDWSIYDRHFGPYFDGSAFEGSKRGPIPVPYAYLPFCFDWPSSYEKWGTEGYKIENRRILLDFIKHFEEKGWTNTVFEIFSNHKKRYRFFPYDGDEVRHEHDTEATYIFGDIFTELLNISKVKLVIRTDASWSFGKHYNTELSKIINMWTVGSGIAEFYPDAFSYMKYQGNILWIYGGVGNMDADMTHILEFAMRCLHNDFGGFLYWNSTGIGNDFLTCPSSLGSVTLYYPSHPFGIDGGVFPSIRLKYQRNVMQTVDLVKMYEGTWTFEDMRSAINEIYGNTRDMWYSPLSEEMKVEPHELTNEIIGGSPRNNPSKNADPDILARIRDKILDMADNFSGAKSRWV